MCQNIKVLSDILLSNQIVLEGKELIGPCCHEDNQFDNRYDGDFSIELIGVSEVNVVLFVPRIVL
jgi:hypothetical protein